MVLCKPKGVHFELAIVSFNYFITTKAKALIASLSFTAIVAAAANPVMAAGLWDTKTNWAKTSIDTLVSRGVITGYPDGSFKPDTSVTRAEFAKVVVKAMKLPLMTTAKFSDMPKWHWANAYIGTLADKGILAGYPDGTFGPKRNITRAEMTAVLTRVMNLAEKNEAYTVPMLANFTDVPKDNWAFKSVETANRLGILPPHYAGTFIPARPVTRAEVAHTVKSLMDLNVINGKIAWVDQSTKAITVNKDNGQQDLLPISMMTTLFRNNITTTADNLIEGDKIYAVSSPEGEPLFVKAYGKVTKADVLGKASAATSGLLTPYQLQSLATGNWNAVKTDLSASLLSRLMENGLRYDEAAAIMTKDWNSLQGSAKERLTEAVSQELNITPDVITALTTQDWKKAGDLAKEQLAQLALQKLITM